MCIDSHRFPLMFEDVRRCSVCFRMLLNIRLNDSDVFLRSMLEEVGGPFF